MIEARDLSKKFRDNTVLDGVSFHIAEGETVGLFGDSGAGKSTITKLLCGIYQPDSGEIYLDGEILAAKGRRYDRALGLAIQPVYQQPHAALDPKQKIASAFREVIRCHKMAKSSGQEDEMIEQALGAVGLGTSILSHLPHQISGGEAQRICIAKCLLFNPRLLILDEATSMLDVSTQANVLGMVRKQIGLRKGSILLISHDRKLTEYLSDRIYIIDNSRLEEL